MRQNVSWFVIYRPTTGGQEAFACRWPAQTWAGMAGCLITDMGSGVSRHGSCRWAPEVERSEGPRWTIGWAIFLYYNIFNSIKCHVRPCQTRAIQTATSNCLNLGLRVNGVIALFLNLALRYSFGCVCPSFVWLFIVVAILQIIH